MYLPECEMGSPKWHRAIWAMRVYQSLSSLRTAMKASVGTCTVPRFRIFFLPAPHKSKLLWGPRIRSKWPEMNSAHFKVLPAAKRLDAALAAGRQKESIAVQLEDGHEGLGGNLYGSQIPHLLLACSPQKQAFVGSPDQIQMAGNEFRPFQGFACGKTLGRRTCGGKAKRINRCPA